MKNKLIMTVAIFLINAPAFADWHYLSKITKVTVRGDRFYVQGTNPAGHSCVDESAYYGTLAHESAQPGHKEYYSMVLLAQATEKGLACYVSATLSNGVCLMDNCHLL